MTLQRIFLLNVLSYINMYAFLPQPGDNLWYIISQIGNNIDILSLCTPIPIQQFPTNISQPGVYCLISDVSAPTGSESITISSSDVYLDLNGHTISNVTQNTAIEILDSNNRVIVQNGFIDNCGAGITLDNANSAIIIRNIRMTRCFDGISASFALNVTVSNVQFYELSDTGIFYQDCSDITIQNSIAADFIPNPDFGPGLGYGFYISLVNNTENANVLIQDCQSNNNIKGFVINSDISTPGLSTAINIDNCISQGNMNNGFELVSSATVTLSCTNCIASRNNTGFNISCIGGYFENCIAQSNQTNGFSNDTIVLPGSLMQSTVINNCTAHNNGQTGFNFPSPSIQNMLISCTATRNNMGFSVPTNNNITMALNSAINNATNYSARGNQSALIASISTDTAQYPDNLQG